MHVAMRTKYECWTTASTRANKSGSPRSPPPRSKPTLLPLLPMNCSFKSGARGKRRAPWPSSNGCWASPDPPSAQGRLAQSRRQEILHVLRGVEARERLETAHQLRAFVG